MVSAEEPSRSRLDKCFITGRYQAPHKCSSPFFPEVHTSSQYCGTPPTHLASVLLLQLRSHLLRCWRKRIWEPASSGWVCGRTFLPAHSYRMEGKGEPSVQAMQSHICTRWMCLLGGWTSGLSAALYGCDPSLSGQDARQWGSRSGCSFTQGPEEHDRPGSTHHQSHRPGHLAFDVKPDNIRAPPLAHDDRNERGGQSSIPRRFHQAACLDQLWRALLNATWRLKSRLKRCNTSSLSAPALLLLPVAQGLRRLSTTQPPLSPDLLRVGEIEGALGAKEPGPRSPWMDVTT